MTNNYSLTGPIIQVNESKKIQNIVIMLHGYGSNGDDLIQIAHTWKNDFPYVLFSAPNAPFEFAKLTGRYKWFEVYPDGKSINEASDQQKKNTLNEYNNSCDLITDHIYKLSEKYNININKFFLMGFSQGSMMSIEVGTKLKKPVAGIISLSGRIYSENFNEIKRNNVPILVVHGESDEIIKTHRYYETCNILTESNYNVQKYLIKNMGHTINSEVLEISKNFIITYK